MGSRLVEILTEQRGNLSVNPGSLVPSTSSPIEQTTNPKGSSSTNIILQREKLSTSLDGATSTSRPVLQIPPFALNGGVDPEEGGGIVEQVVISFPAEGNEDYEGILQQLNFNNLVDFAQDASVSKLVEQIISKRDTAATGTPIEQVAKITNFVNIEQFNFIELVFPPCGSIKNPVDSNLLWRIRDFGFPFDADTLIFRVNGFDVQDSSDFSITDLGNGLELFYNPPINFQFNETVLVFVEIKDTAVPVNTFAVRCSFSTVSDTRAPVISNVIPCGQSAVPVTSAVSFDVVDVGYGIDAEQLVLSIEGLPVCSGITLDEITLTSGTGYHVTWEHPGNPFRYDSNVTVSIEAADLSPLQNRTLYICSFDTESSSPPEFYNFDPDACSSFIDTATGLRFEVYGNVAGVDVSTLEVQIDNVLRKVIVRPRVLRSL